jgi:hypothetical protein
MDKQKKQMILLGAAVVVLLIVAAINFGVFDKKTPPPPPPPPPAEPVVTAPTAPPAPGTPAAPASETRNLEIPEETIFLTRVQTWPEVAPRGGKDWEPAGDERWPFDPLLVKNVEIVNPEMRRYIEEIKRTWVLAGITRTWQWVTERIPVETASEENGENGEANPDIIDDDDGEDPSEKFEEVRVRKLVTEAWFLGRRAPFRINDRLTNTRFVITDIVFGPDPSDPNLTPRALVRLRGDMGEMLDIELAPTGRYGEDDAGRGAGTAGRRPR